MDPIFLLKAGFMGFALSVGVQMLFFFLAGRLQKVTEKNFFRVFVLAAVASFVVLYFFLHHKILVNFKMTDAQAADAQLFLSGCIGGWLGGLVFGATQLKRFLLGLAR